VLYILTRRGRTLRKEENPMTPTIEALSAWAHASERVLGQFVELSASAARETLRTYGEMQAATLQAVREAGPSMPGEGEAPAASDWYAAAVEQSGRLAKLLESQLQIMARGNQRLQDAAERAGKEIRETVETYVSQTMKEMYSGK
jgi:hypothetical protein